MGRPQLTARLLATPANVEVVDGAVANLHFLRLTAQYAWAQESVESKQRERFLEAVNFYQQFIDTYPKSKSLKAAQDMYDVSQSSLTRLKATPTAASN